MKKTSLYILIAFCGLLGCNKTSLVEEKLVFSASDIKKCECPKSSNTVCYFDTIKTLFSLSNVQGILYNIPTYNFTSNIIIENSTSYVKGGAEFGQPFYWWKIMNGNLGPCNMPNEIYSTTKYDGRRVIFSADVLEVPPPRTGQTYSSSNGYSIILKEIKIL